MKHPNIQSGVLALVFLPLCACTGGIRDSGGGCEGPFIPIHQVQGSEAASPKLGERVTVRGLVVGDFQRSDQLGGFFIQDPQADDDARTSQGLFINALDVTDVASGDLVQLSGDVAETAGLTELTSVKRIAVCASSAPPEPTPLDPSALDDLERYEGMLVALTGEMTVASTHDLGRRGQLLLAAGPRPFKRTNSPPAHIEHRPRLLLDDGSHAEDLPAPPYLDPAGARRAGDVVSGLVGIIAEKEDKYMLHPTASPDFTAGNPRADAPPAVGGTVKVANFNLLNFFTTLGERGASNATELVRQRAKHVAAISRLDADIIGLNELENNDEVAIRDLVGALNAAAGRGKSGEELWAHVPNPPGGLSEDPIRVGLIYRPGTVRAAGPPIIDRDPVFKRPPVAQIFEVRGERFAVVVNHFKSKSCSHAEGVEADAGDGQGCWNPLRTRQARRLLDFVGRLQSRNDNIGVLVIGDLNAYGAEDPIRALTRGGLVDQIAVHVPVAERYSYVYNGEAGYLDHALTTANLARRVTGAAFWHINSDEPPLLDYNTEHQRPGLYQPDPFRSSDHDPVLIGLEF